MNQGNDTYREQMEVRLVALLLGEASEFEQAELRDAMEKDASLAAFHAEMKATLGLVQEASKKFTDTPAVATQPKLSPERRDKLMATFKVVKPKELGGKRNARRWVMRLGWAAGLMLAAYVTISSLQTVRSRSASMESIGEDAPSYLGLPHAKVRRDVIVGKTVIPKDSAPSVDALTVAAPAYAPEPTDKSMPPNDQSTIFLPASQPPPPTATPAQHFGGVAATDGQVSLGLERSADSAQDQQQSSYRETRKLAIMDRGAAANKPNEASQPQPVADFALQDANPQDVTAVLKKQFDDAKKPAIQPTAPPPGNVPRFGAGSPQSSVVAKAGTDLALAQTDKQKEPDQSSLFGSAESPQEFYSKTFHVDPNTFVPALDSVSRQIQADLVSGGGSNRGGGGGGGGGGQVPRTESDPSNVPQTLNLPEMTQLYLTAAGVNVSGQGRSVLFNDDSGTLTIRGTKQDLATVEAAINALDKPPAQMSVEAKFAEVNQNDSRALGFDWYQSNTLIGGRTAGGGASLSQNTADTVAVPPAAMVGAMGGGGMGGPGKPSQSGQSSVAMNVQNGKFLYEAGKYDEAEAKLKEAAKADPNNRAAYYYLDLTKEARNGSENRAREAVAKSSIADITKSWLPRSDDKPAAEVAARRRTDPNATSSGVFLPPVATPPSEPALAVPNTPVLADVPTLGRMFQSEAKRGVDPQPVPIAGTTTLPSIPPQSASAAPTHSVPTLAQETPVVPAAPAVTPPNSSADGAAKPAGKPAAKAEQIAANTSLSEPETVRRQATELRRKMAVQDAKKQITATFGGAKITDENTLVTATRYPERTDRLARADASAVKDKYSDAGRGDRLEQDKQLGSAKNMIRQPEDLGALRPLHDQVDNVVEKAGPSHSVRIIDFPEANGSTTFWGKARKAITGKVETRMLVETLKDAPDYGKSPDRAAFDPYYLETEFQIIKSTPVIESAAKKLNLNKTWNESRGKSRKLSDREIVDKLTAMIHVQPDPSTSLIDIRVDGSDAAEGARIASAVAEAYAEFRSSKHAERVAAYAEALEKRNQQIAPSENKSKDNLPNAPTVIASDTPIKHASGPIPTPQPETTTAENAFSTFSLNVSDVTFKLAQASLQNNTLPDPASIRVEEFVNAFNYRDPAPLPGSRLAFAWERARYPFAHNRDVLRLGIQTAARGREAQKPLNLVILLDNSGSMERPDRVAIMREALKVLAAQLQPQDRISVVAFARTAHLWVDGMAGGHPDEFLAKVLDLNPEGGTNLEDAMNLGYETAARHFMANGVNRVILLTDGAANLGNVEPEDLKKKVVANRQKGIALDCYGIGWEGYNDDLLEVLSRNGDGRYGFLNQPEQAGPEFANQLAGALNVAAADVKTQVEFNPARVTTWRQIGYAKHQLTKEQFRDNTVDAAEIAAAEQGNALYVIEVNPQGSGPLGTVRVRFKAPETGEYIEQAWPLAYQPQPPALENASPAMRLAVSAAAFGEWLSASPYAADVTPAALQATLAGIPECFTPDPRPNHLATMIRQAQALAGK